MPVSEAFLASRQWASSRVHAATTLRHGAGASSAPFDTFNLGARCGDLPHVVALNRAQLQELAALPSTPHWLQQVHGTRVLRFEAAPRSVATIDSPSVDAHCGSAAIPSQCDAAASEPRGDAATGEPRADAAVTSTPGVVLAVLTADCLPVVLAARDGSEVAVAHAGWRGLQAGVLEATLAAMRTPVDTVQAWLGPAAGPLAYEVGAEVRGAFLDSDGATADGALRATRPGHWLCDLYALARMRLAASGVADMAGGERCTISEPGAFFSHRRDGRSGRMATLAWTDEA